MGGKEFRAELLLLLLLESFTPERLQYSTTHSTAVFWSGTSTDGMPHSIADLPHWTLNTIQELFFKNRLIVTLDSYNKGE